MEPASGKRKSAPVCRPKSVCDTVDVSVPTGYARSIMPVPCIIHGHLSTRKLLSLLALAVVTAFVTKDACAKDTGPPLRIPLEPLGFQLPQTQFLLAGSTMMTVDYVDDRHLLLTYSAKRLLKRLPECPPSDQDRVVEAVLLSLPDGKELARTSWRLHDRGQYLWRLGHGRFLLRNRDSLVTIAPVVNQASGHAFLERPLIETKRRIGGILLSPDADLLILETLEPRRPAGLEEASGALPAAQTEAERALAENPVQINFFTLSYGSGDQIELISGEALRSRVPGRIPANSAGFISILDQGQQHWAFDFNTYDGKKLELSPFDSTCKPSPILVSRAAFIAFGCHMSHTPQVIGGFNMRGEEMWEQNLMETYLAPTFSYAPAAGRFAFSRMLTHTSLITDETISQELVAGQNIVVYQTDTGSQLLRVNATPVARAGQNYTLSPSGTGLAVIRTDAIEIYALPELSGKDREALQKAEAAAPQLGVRTRTNPMPSSPAPVSSGSADDRTEAQSSPQPAQSDGTARAPETSVTQPATESRPAEPATQPAPASQAAEGDEQAPRKPPTLYNEPGEHPPAQPDRPR